MLTTHAADAATGINKQISFQGKVVAKADGTNVTDGSYSFTFRIYNASSGSTGSPCLSACIWEETKTLTVTSGIFQTNLGDTTALPGSVDFNSDTLYLSVKFNGDTEMSPRIRLAAVPYAFNADKLGGLASSSFAQLSPGSQQTGTLNISGDLNVGSGSAFKINTTTVCSGTTCTPSSGSSFYIQNGTGSQTANFNIQSAASSSIGGIIKGATSQSVDLLELQNSSSNVLTNFDQKGYLHIARAAAAADTAISIRVNGDTNDRFNIAADGTMYWGSGSASSDVDLYRSGTNAIKTDNNFIAGTHLWAGAGSGNLTSTLGVTSGVSTQVGAIIQGVASQTADLLQLQNNAGSILDKVDAKGNISISSSSNASGAGHLFTDGFESGNVKLWDKGTIVNGGSSLAANSTTVHHGKYSLKMVAAGAASVARASITGSSTTVLRGYVNLTSNTGDVGLMELDTTSPANSFQLYYNSATSKLALWNNAAATSTDIATTFSLNTWHEVEFDLTIGSSTGAATIYLDGTSVLSQTSINTGTANPNQVSVGTPTADTGTAYYDDVVVDTVRPGDGGSLYLGESLHVSGSSSFGGLALFQGGSNSTTAFQVQNAAGTANLIVADTVNNTVGIGKAPGTTYALDVNGGGQFSSSVNISGAYQINGNNVLSYFTNYNILRSANASGGLQVWNAANSSAIATLTDAGGLTVSSYLSASTLQTASGDLTINPVGNTKITGSTADSSTIALTVTDSSGSNGLLQVRNDGIVAIGSQYGIDTNAGPGDLAVDGSFWSGGNQGVTGTCQAGTALTGTQVVGGIVTGGNCAGVTTSLQDVYTSSSTGGSAPSTPTLVRQSTTNSSGTASFVASFTTTAGDLLVLSASPNNANYWITSITDDAGDTWKEVGSAHGAIGSNGSYSRAQMWYTYNTARTGVTNLTITLNGSVQIALNANEYSGVATTADPLDGSSTKATGNVGTVTSPSLTTGNDNDLYVANFGWNTSPTVSSHNWTALTQSNVGTSHSLATSYTTGSAGTYQASWTMSANVNVGTVIGAFKANTGTSTIARIKLDGSKDLAVRTTNNNAMLTFSNTTNTIVVGPGDTSTAADPTAGVNGAMYYNATLNKMRCYINSGWTNCSGVPYFPDRHWGLTAQNTATPGIFTGTSQGGDIGALSYTTGTGTASADSSQTEDSYLVAPTTSTNGNSAVLSTVDGTEERWRPYFTTRVRVNSTGSERIFVGMSTNTAGSMTDTPTTASWVGFRYSTSASDTAWKCGSGDGSASSYSAVGSLPAIATSAYYDLTIDWTTAGQIVCTVRVSGGTSYSVTKTTNLPTGSTVLNYFTQITTLTAAVRQIEQAYIYIERN